MLYAPPGSPDAKVQYKARYDNFIGGKFVPPVKGAYFDVLTPITGKAYTQAARSTAEDIELALDAAHAAAPQWGRTPAADRANLLLKIADRIEQNLEKLAYAETVDNGKAIRETLNADIPLTVDHFRYFAGCLRSQEGSLSEIDADTVAYHFHEPLGVVGQIIPWNFPILMAAWKLAPALAAGNCVILKPAESTPISILVLIELIADLLPAGVVNVVNGYGREAGMPLASSRRIAKIAFTGSTATGKVIAQAAANNLIPATLELGGKSPNIFFADVADADDDFFDKAIEGLVLFAFNQGEVCTCPSRALIQESIYDKFMDRALARVRAIKQGSPLDTDSMMGAQASIEQMKKIESYLSLGKEEGAQVLTGGDRAQLPGDLAGGYYIQPTLFKGHNKMRIFQEEIFGPVLSVIRVESFDEAMAAANDSPFGLTSSIYTRDAMRMFRYIDEIETGMTHVNSPTLGGEAQVPFGGTKETAVGPTEQGTEVFDFYTETKVAYIDYTGAKREGKLY